MSKSKNNTGNKIISPKGTAVWLVKNTTLTFNQIADFCGFNEMTVKLIADGIIEKNLSPFDPVRNGTLTIAEIKAREKDGGKLSNVKSVYEIIGVKQKTTKKYISTSKKRNKPEIILYLLQYYPELTNAQIVKLARTTAPMVESIRNKSYKNLQDLVAKDPIVLGICTQKQLNDQLDIARNKTENNTQKPLKKKNIRKINVNTVKKLK